MKNATVNFVMSCLIMLGISCDGPQKTSSVTLTPDEAKSIAKEAYTFNYSMVMMYRTMYVQSIDPTSKSYSGGFGHWLHLGTSTPEDTDIVSPNNDSPYSYAWVDTRAEPWVLTMPKIESDRFYTSQWDDLWGFVLGNPGSVEDGNDGVSVLLTSPTWNGELPKGVKRAIHGDTDFLGSLTRTQLKYPEDIVNVEKIQKEYKLEPLSSYLGTNPPAPVPSIDWMPWVEGVEKTSEFWEYVNFLLTYTTPNLQDKPVQDRMLKIGLKAGEKWNESSFDKEIRDAIAAGMKEAIDEFASGALTITDPSLFFRSRKDLNKDYFNRGLGVNVGLFGNVKKVSVYFASSKDDKGELYDGSKYNYTQTFTADQIPIVKNFWSYTMYKLPQRWLVDNPINRYSIGSATPGLKIEADGSIIIYMQTESPGKDKESNWLPTPNGPFWPILRTYGPGRTLLNGSWEQPEIKQVPKS